MFKLGETICPRLVKCAKLVELFAQGWLFCDQPCAAKPQLVVLYGHFRVQGWRHFNQPCALGAPYGYSRSPCCGQLRYASSFGAALAISALEVPGVVVQAVGLRKPSRKDLTSMRFLPLSCRSVMAMAPSCVATAKSVYIRKRTVGTPCQVMVVGELRNSEERRIVRLIRIDKHLRRSLAVLENDGIARQRARIRQSTRFKILSEARLACTKLGDSFGHLVRRSVMSRNAG